MRRSEEENEEGNKEGMRRGDWVIRCEVCEEGV